MDLPFLVCPLSPRQNRCLVARRGRCGCLSIMPDTGFLSASFGTSFYLPESGEFVFYSTLTADHNLLIQFK